ncbi:MAG: PKD domain-containing protein, partial [Dehalococcoidia bacterium]
MRTADSGQRLLHPIRPVALAVALIIVAGVLLVGGDRAAAQPGQLRVSAGGPYTGQVGSPVVVMAAVDFGGREPTTAISFDWDFGDGTVETGSGQTTSHVYTQPGTYTLTVTLFLLASRETATDSTTVEVSGGQVPGQLSISAGGPYSGQVGDNIIFSSRFDLGGRPPNTAIEIEWDFGDGTRDMGQTTAHVYSNPGTYTVTVTLFVLAGRETATDSTTAQIRAGSPTLSANAGGPYTGAVGQPVAMTGSASPLPADVAVNFSWTFGDGASGTGRTPSHTYSAAGTYTVTLNVTVPATGQQASATTTATISTGQPQTERVPLPTGCSNQALTWPVGTPMGTVANAVSPPGVVLSIFRLDPVQQRFRGFSPSAPSFAN